ncbi:hypothetical protein JDV09_10805 [Mycobacterium sp. Y57]|uniref:DUF5994 family protein n=1 Tax=Mycolicibacterium xanthum TaxID=2796469 RepID=UPI001C84AD36|nr:DUF5994 family protein [Mycolicibacterium xanthum]MBX7432588.1 hypothetical protein [Mycolicibacterium xanthum]
MAKQNRGVGFGQRHNGPQNTPRLRLKRKTIHRGRVDGAWWPHSTDLTTELPDLVAVLSVRLGEVARVTYNRAEWSTAPAKIRIDDRIVRLDGYDRQPVNTLGVLDSHGRGTVLLVVPAQTSAEGAHTLMMSAAGAEDESGIDDLLATAQGSLR